MLFEQCIIFTKLKPLKLLHPFNLRTFHNYKVILKVKISHSEQLSYCSLFVLAPVHSQKLSVFYFNAMDFSMSQDSRCHGISNTTTLALTPSHYNRFCIPAYS